MARSSFAPSILREPLNQSSAAVSGSFAPTDRFENLEICKGFPQVPSLNLERNPSMTTLAIESELPQFFIAEKFSSCNLSVATATIFA